MNKLDEKAFEKVSGGSSAQDTKGCSFYPDSCFAALSGYGSCYCSGYGSAYGSGYGSSFGFGSGYGSSFGFGSGY